MASSSKRSKRQFHNIGLSWTIKLELRGHGMGGHHGWTYSGVPTHGCEIPRSKAPKDGPDEKQVIHRTPGWWFILKNRNYAPLVPLRLNKAVPFPRKGQWNAKLTVAYDDVTVCANVASFDFTARPLPAHAKIHADKSHTKRGAAKSSPTTDFIFYRIVNRCLTVIRVFIPLRDILLVPSLRQWASPNRMKSMYEEAGVRYPGSANKVMAHFGISDELHTPSAATATSSSSFVLLSSTELGEEEDGIESSSDEFSIFSDDDSLAPNGANEAEGFIRSLHRKRQRGDDSRENAIGGGSFAPKNARRSTLMDVDTPLMVLSSDESSPAMASTQRDSSGRASTRAAHRGDSRAAIKTRARRKRRHPVERRVIVVYGSSEGEKRIVGSNKRRRGAANAPTRNVVSGSTSSCAPHHRQQRGLAERIPLEVLGLSESTLRKMQNKDVVGTGSFASVFRACDSSSGVDVAVKLFKSREPPSRINKELTILKHLQGHQNVVSLVGHIRVGGQKHIVMEYCAMGNLYEVLHSVDTTPIVMSDRSLRKLRGSNGETPLGIDRESLVRNRRRSKRLSGKSLEDLHRRQAAGEVTNASVIDPCIELKRRRWSILLGIAQGLRHLHENDVCHRDLSSMNVLLDHSWRPKIADFGLSAINQDRMFSMGVGTARWRAPEVFRNKPKHLRKHFERYYTNSADVYSFGVIVWELFHIGHTPWESELDTEVPRKVLAGERIEIARDVPQCWRSLIEHCWRQKPSARPTMEEIVLYIKDHSHEEK